MSFIQEIKTGKRKINPKIKEFEMNAITFMMIALMGIITLKIIGIDLI